jgi:hypothetical protein
LLSLLLSPGSNHSLARIFHESLAATTDMSVLPGVFGCRPLRRTVQVRKPTPCGCQARGASACAARGTPILFALALLRSVPQAGSQFCGLVTAIETPCSPPAEDRESSKCKVLKAFYCSSLAHPAARLVDETCRQAEVVSLRGCAR